MKKVLFLLAAAAMMLVSSQNAKAQLYVGGSIGYSTTTMHDGQGGSFSGSSYKFLPEAGFKLNDKMAVGGSIGILQGYAALGSFNPNDLKGFLEMSLSAYADFSADDSRFTCTRIAPYFRYNLLSSRHVDIFVDAVLSIGAIKMRENDEGIWHDVSNFTAVEIAARPGFSYNIDSNVSIVGHLGSIGFQSLSIPDTDAKITRLGMDLDSNNILIGFEYHF